ncbi:MAG: mechanosensitive ion channel family protein [Gallionella sp.]
MNGFFAADTLLGASLYGVVFLIAAFVLARLVRKAERRIEVHLTDATGLRFASALAQILIYFLACVLYAHLIPELRSLATAVLAGAGVASVVVGLAAQSTLSNLIAGVSLVLNRAISIGDKVKLNTPNGLTTATVEQLSLGYTMLRGLDGSEILVPNSIMVSSILIRIDGKEG